MGQLNTRMPLVGKVPPWRQPLEAGGPERAAAVRLAPARRPDRSAGASRTARRSGTSASRRPVAAGRSGQAGPTDDEGGPGDTPASVAWLRAGRGHAATSARPADRLRPRRPLDRRPPAIDPESGQLDRRRARRTAERARTGSDGPSRWDRDRPPRRRRRTQGAARGPVLGRPRRAGAAAAGPRRHRRVGLSRLGALARVLRPDRRLPAPPVDPLGRDARDRRAAHRHRPARAGDDARPGRRPVRQARRRDAQADQARPARPRACSPRSTRRSSSSSTTAPSASTSTACPEEIPEVFEMLQAADTVGVFQVESRAQMQTLPKSPAAEPRRPRGRGRDHPAGPDPGQRRPPVPAPQAGPRAGDLPPPEPRAGPARHPGRDPVPGAGHADRDRRRRASRPADSDGFRRAMGTWRSTREMEKLHAQFVEGCLRQPGMAERRSPRSCSARSPRSPSFGFAKSHAAAFARTAYESAFLKLFYPAQFVVGLINAQPMGFYPVEVLVNDAKRHGVAVLPVDVNASRVQDDDRMGGPAGLGAGRPTATTDRTTRPASRCPTARIDRPSVVGLRDRRRGARPLDAGVDGRLGRPPRAAPGQGDRRGARGAARRGARPRAVHGAWPTWSSGPGSPEEVVERLIRAGGLDSLGRPRRELLWQLREVAGASRGRVDGRALRGSPAAGTARGRAADGPAPAGDRRRRHSPRSPSRSGSATRTR